MVEEWDAVLLLLPLLVLVLVLLLVRRVGAVFVERHNEDGIVRCLLLRRVDHNGRRRVVVPRIDDGNDPDR